MDKIRKRLFEGTKGQITVFIIIGIVIVAAVSIFLVVRSQQAGLPEETIVSERTPDEFKPVKDFVESCLNQKLKEAFIKIGQHGGYVDMEDRDMSGSQFVLKPDDPTSSDAAFLDSLPSSNVAYWWYMKTPNTCNNCLLTDENKPSFEYIQEQSNKYIEENLDECIDGFRNFEQQGFDINELARPSVNTTITEEDVAVMLDYPINASLDDKNTLISQYYTSIPLGFRDFYELADAITYAEINTSFLEYVPKQILGVYSSGTDTGKLPPIYAREESYAPKIWSKNLVKYEFRSVLTSMMPFLSLANTKNAHPYTTDDAITTGLHRPFYYDTLLNKSYDDFTVNFYYFNWPIYFYVGPASGEILGATKVIDIPNAIGPISLFPSVPIREYAFFYDITYPVIVEIRRDSDLFGEGYSLLFALESNIRDNRDMKEWKEGNGTYGSDIQDLFSVSNVAETEFPETQEEAEMGLAGYVNRTKQESKSLFCDPKQRLSGNITITTKDAISGNGVPGVKVKFGCGAYEFCTIGTTQFEVETNQTVITDKFPICRGGGILKLEKEGYLDSITLDLTIEQNSSQDFEVLMSPLVKKEVKITKMMANRSILYWQPYKKYGRNYTKRIVMTDQELPLNPEDDDVLLMIRKVDINPLVTYPTQVVSYDPDVNSSTIELAEGVYEIKSNFVNKSGANVTPNLRCNSMDAYMCYLRRNESAKEGEMADVGNCNCYFVPEDPIVMEQAISGGIEFTNESSYWIVTKEELAENNSIEFKIIQLPPIKLVEDFDEMGLIVNITNQYRSLLEPVFIPE